MKLKEIGSESDDGNNLMTPHVMHDNVVISLRVVPVYYVGCMVFGFPEPEGLEHVVRKRLIVLESITPYC